VNNCSFFAAGTGSDSTALTWLVLQEDFCAAFAIVQPAVACSFQRCMQLFLASYDANNAMLCWQLLSLFLTTAG
jgi:hypothetical protein